MFCKTLKMWPIKKAHKNRNLSALGVELLNKCINMEGEVRNLAAITLYLEGIVKFSRLRKGEMRKGDNSLQQFLPLNFKKKSLLLILNQQWNLQQRHLPRHSAGLARQQLQAQR